MNIRWDGPPMVLQKGKEIGMQSRMLCLMCKESISTGPFYSCEGYYWGLHKVCGELPNEMKHPMHPQHPLTLGERDKIQCHICMKLDYRHRSVYSCSICDFYVDVICASASLTIESKCHMHPLIPIHLPSCFLCSICCKEKKGVSYKCVSCPFWVHQDCTLLPNFVECRDHDHQQLTLLPSIPYEVIQKLNHNFECKICYAEITPYETVYSCVGCLFFSHARCATADAEDYEDDDVNTKHLPVKDWTTLISSIGEDDDEHAGDLTNNTELPEQISDPDKLIDNEFDHFSHEHVLHLHDGQWNDNVCEKVCDACAEPILGPSYGCTRCDYFLHECCIRLPEHILHPAHPQHYIELFAQFPDRVVALFRCCYCHQICNTFGYRCKECDFEIDVKCASLSGRIKHEAHKHTLFYDVSNYITCSTCTTEFYDEGRRCEECSFNLCLTCTRLPPIVNHRYCKCQGLRLQYSPLKNYNIDYICDFCEGYLNPHKWFYHCGACDQFAHPTCLLHNAGNSNIKFGKRYNLPNLHEHELIITHFTYEYSNCKICVSSLNNAKVFAAGFECATCPYFKIHLKCVQGKLGNIIEEEERWEQW